MARQRAAAGAVRDGARHRRRHPPHCRAGDDRGRRCRARRNSVSGRRGTARVRSRPARSSGATPPRRSPHSAVASDRRRDHRTDSKVLIDNPLSGIELALWDISAREADVPLHELLGTSVAPKLRSRSTSRTATVASQSPTEVAAYCARMIEDHDSPAFEGKVGVRSAATTIFTRAREIRAAIGEAHAASRREHGLDVGDGARRAVAARAARRRERRGAGRLVRRHGRAAIATTIPFSSHIPDTCARGRARRAACDRDRPRFLRRNRGERSGSSPNANEAGDGFWFYSGDLGIATAAYLHVAAATPYLDRPSQSLLRWTTDDVIAGGPFQPERGVVPVPEGPGLGVELDEQALARCVERYAREGAYDFYGGPSLPRY